MDKSKDDNVPVCAFCKEGRWADEVCGKLHVEKIDGGKKVISAHHKCMQYSAGLIQYKFDHYGGFKIDKVQQEISRGNKINCAICKLDRKRKGKWKGATAGCAVKSCRKSFHYYCAKIDPVAITKRMLIRYKNDNKEVVLYRVFCGEAHRDIFKAKKEDFIANKTSNNDDTSDESIDPNDETDDSNNNTDDEDTTERKGDDNLLMDCVSIHTIGSPDPSRSNMSSVYSPNVSRIEKKDGEEHRGEGDASLSTLGQFASSTPVSEQHRGDVKKRKNIATLGRKLSPTKEYENEIGYNNTSNEAESDNNAEDHDFERSDTKNISRDTSKSKMSPKSQQSKVSSTVESESAELKSRINGKSPSHRRILSLSRNKSDSKVSETAQHKQIYDVKKQDVNERVSSSETDISDSERKSYPECLLVILDKLNVSNIDALKSEVCASVEEFGIKEENCMIWSDLFDFTGISDAEKKLPHLMSEVVTMFTEKDYRKIVKLLTDREKMKSQLQNYTYVLNLQATLDKKVAQIMEKSLFDTVRTGLNDASKICKYNVGKLVNLECNQNMNAFILVINDTFDSQAKIRSQFLKNSLNTFRISSPSQCLSKDKQKVKSDEELCRLFRFIECQISGKFQLSCVPEDPVFLPDNKVMNESQGCPNQNYSVIDSLETQLKQLDTKAKMKSGHVLVIRNVDTKVINYKPFSHKVIQQYISEHDSKQNLIIVVDISSSDFRTLNDIIPARVRNENSDLSVYTAVQPDRYMVTCAVLHLKTRPSASTSNGKVDNKRSSPVVSLKEASVNGVDYDTSDEEASSQYNRRCSRRRSNHKITDNPTTNSPSSTQSSPRRGLKRSSDISELGNQTPKHARK